MVWATSCPLLGGGGWERWGWRVGGGLQADQPRSWSQGPWSSNQRPWGLDPDEGHWGTKLGSGEGRGPSKQPVRGGLHVPERGRVKGLSRNLTQPPAFLSPLFRVGWEKRRGWGQAAKREEGECACVDNPTRNQTVLKGRKREKQPTPGTTRQEAGIPALPHVLCNLKLRAPGPQAPQMSDKELEQVASGDPLGQKGPRSLERGGSSRGQVKEPQSPGGRRRRPGAVPASVRRGSSLRTATGPSLSWERGRVTAAPVTRMVKCTGYSGALGTCSRSTHLGVCDPYISPIRGAGQGACPYLR